MDEDGCTQSAFLQPDSFMIRCVGESRPFRGHLLVLRIVLEFFGSGLQLRQPSHKVGLGVFCSPFTLL